MQFSVSNVFTIYGELITRLVSWKPTLTGPVMDDEAEKIAENPGNLEVITEKLDKLLKITDSTSRDVQNLDQTEKTGHFDWFIN